jgi:hypothetical protein
MWTYLGFPPSAALAAMGEWIGPLWIAIRDSLRSPGGRHTGIVFALLAFAGLCSWSIRRSSLSFAQQWLRPLLPGEDSSTLAIAEGILNSNQAVRLQRQFNDLKGRAVHHMDVMIVFYRNYYSAIIMASVFGAVSAIALLFITTGGWNDSNRYVKTVFLTSTALAALFKAYPAIFKQQENIRNNKNLYLKYVALRNEISSYAATGVAYLARANATAVDFIHHVDERMESLNDIAIGLDASKIPVLDDLLAKAKAVRSDTTTAAVPEAARPAVEGLPEERPAAAKGKEVKTNQNNGAVSETPPGAAGADTQEKLTVASEIAA